MARKKSSKHIPLAVLRRRRDRLARLLAKRAGSRQAKNKIPYHVLEARILCLDRIIAKRA